MDNNIAETTTPEEINTKDFKFKTELNPQIWETEDKLNPKVKDGLLKIVSKYMEFLDLPENITPIDIVLTGSLANFNYTKFSDLDVHIIIDYSKLGEDHDLLMSFFKDKKDIWSDKYKITIFGYPVELFAQDKNEKNDWTATYSLQHDKWIQKPDKTKPEIDTEQIKKKASIIVNEIDSIIESEGEDFDKAIKKIDKLWDRIKHMRQAALEEGGEFSTENLVFKYLRNYGYLEKLTKFQEYITKQLLSIKEKTVKKNKKIAISEDQFEKLRGLYKN